MTRSASGAAPIERHAITRSGRTRIAPSGPNSRRRMNASRGSSQSPSACPRRSAQADAARLRRGLGGLTPGVTALAGNQREASGRRDLPECLALAFAFNSNNLQTLETK